MVVLKDWKGLPGDSVEFPFSGIVKLSWTLNHTLRFDVSCALSGCSRRPIEDPFTEFFLQFFILRAEAQCSDKYWKQNKA